MTRHAALIRTHKMGPEEERLIAALRPAFGADIILCMDARQTPPPAMSEKCVAMTDAMMRDLGLVFPDSWPWWCGDFCYYAAAEACPGYDHYWLIEPDVVFNRIDTRDFVEAARASTADFMASSAGWANKNWPNGAAVRGFFNTAHQCFFPLTRLSARAIDTLLILRRAYGQYWQAAGLPDTGYANDESFVATAVATQPHLRFESFKAYTPALFDTDPNLYTWRRSILDEDLANLPAGILHPVIDRSTFEGRILGPKSRSWVRADAAYLQGVLNRNYAPARAAEILSQVRWKK